MPTKAKRKLVILEALADHNAHHVNIYDDMLTNYANGEQYENVMLYCEDCNKAIIYGHIYDGTEVENFQP